MPKTTTLKDEIKEELVGFVLLALGIFVSFCLWKGDTSDNITSIGAIGSFFYRVLKSLCGGGRIFVPVLLCLAAISKLTKRSKYDKLTIVSLVALLLSILAILHLNLGLEVKAFASGWQGLGGGVIGALITTISIFLLGQSGSYLFWGVVIVVSAVGIAKRSLIDFVKQTYVCLKRFIIKTRQELVDFLFEQAEIMPDDDDEFEEEEEEKPKRKTKGESVPRVSNPIIIDHVENREAAINEVHSSPAIINNQSSAVKEKETPSQLDLPDNRSQNQIKSNLNESEVYKLPPLTLLKSLAKVKSLRLNKDITDNVRILEETLDNFGVKARVTQVSRGPSITRYELQPPPGVKVSRIVNLADDIALSLATPQVRIEAPIPGKAAVGIEVPNEEIAIVYLREVLETALFQESASKLTVALGKDIAGNPIVADLAKMPHLLIAGATGSGKSVCMNALIASILFKTSPNEVKMLMIDPKVVELSTFNGVSHLVAPVVTDPKKAASALRWVIHEMENRYELFAGLGVKDIQRYNQVMKKAAGEAEFPPLPYIVVLIDELADLMMVAPADVEDAICRLAQMARAAGIHLVIATQRPSVDVITGVIKANIPSRIAFAVSSQIDSRTILDMGGAEHLLGRGDMLFYPTGMAKPIRVQGVYVSDQEIEALVNYIKDQNKPVNSTEPWGNDETETSEPTEEDPLISEAAKIFIESGQASISLLQRRLRIGYNRAARIIDQMEEKGIVGGYEGSKPRAIRMTWEEYEKTYGSSS